MTQPLVVLLQEQTAQLLGTLQEQMTQQRLTLEEQSTHQMLTLQKLQEQLMQQLGMVEERMTQQRAVLQEQTGQQVATIYKLTTLQLAILDNLKNVQSHEIAPDQAQCSLLDQAQCSKTAKKSGQENLFFPEEVIEKVLARMSLPSLLKIRLLSKRWLAKFASQESSLTTLQKEVISVSSTWITYNPVFLTDGGLRGFDRVSSEWKSMFTISHVPFNCWSRRFISSLGPLIFVVFYSSNAEDDRRPVRLIVTNVLTRSWREVIIPPTIDINYDNGMEPEFARLLPGDFDTYRVIIVYHSPSAVKTMLYDSRVREWSVTYTVDLGGIGRFFVSSVYLHGKLYCICDGYEGADPWKLCVHHVDSDKTWMAIPLNVSSLGSVTGGVLLCGKKIMVVIWRDCKFILDFMSSRDPGPLPGAAVPLIQIYHFDLDSLQLVKECNGPSGTVLDVAYSIGDWEEGIRFASDEHSIYFGQILPGFPVLTYNVQSGEWGLIPPDYSEWHNGLDLLLESAFVPGMNPFANI